MLPLLVLRRMDAVLEPTKDEVLEYADGLVEIGPGQDRILKRICGQRFYNTSRYTFARLLSDDKNLADNLAKYIASLSPDAATVIEAYQFDGKITRMDHAGILYGVMADFADLDLRPSEVSNETMGYIFEELLRKFSEMSNETAGEHYTPREVIRLVADLLIGGQTARDLTENQMPVRTIYDPAAGTGGMLMITMDRIKELNPKALVKVFGQELNDETWAIAQSDLMMQGIGPEQMHNGNTLTADAFPTNKFDFILANPPYGVDWKGYAQPIKDEHNRQGFNGRFGAGLPRVSDGSLLFLQHMLSHMKPVTDASPNGSRVGIVLSGSPLFSGQAGSGESEIRRWLLENDWLEGIVALPDQMFYNTGIATYVWVITNRKEERRRGKVQLIDATSWFTPLRKNLGEKGVEISSADGDRVLATLKAFDRADDPDHSKVFDGVDFGYSKIIVERPLRIAGIDPHRIYKTAEIKKLKEEGIRDESAPPVIKKVLPYAAKPDPLRGRYEATIDGRTRVVEYEPDTELRDTDQVPLTEPAGEHADGIEAFFRREVLPYAPDAWIDQSKTKIGYEISFTRHFYKPTPMRTLAEIQADIRALTAETDDLMAEIAGEE